MRVLHVSDRLDTRGGAQRYLLDVLAAQAASGAGAPHLAVATRDSATPCACDVTLVPGLEARERLTAPLEGLEALTARLRPDVVHLHTVVNPAVLEWARAWPSLATVQDHRVFCPGRGKWTRDGLPCRAPLATETCRCCVDDEAYFTAIDALTRARLVALRALSIGVLSHYMRGELVAAGCAPERVHVTPPFVAAPQPALPAGERAFVLFAGRLVEAKGVRDAVAAWRRSGLRLPLVFAGTGPLRTALEREGFEVLGWLAPEQLAATYRRAAALLLPSRWQEPFGIVGLEALSAGTPVVAWESGGIAEWHPGPLAPWGDVDALAALLCAAVNAPAPAPRPGFRRDEGLRALARAYASVRGDDGAARRTLR